MSDVSGAVSNDSALRRWIPSPVGSWITTCDHEEQRNLSFFADFLTFADHQTGGVSDVSGAVSNRLSVT